MKLLLLATWSCGSRSVGGNELSVYHLDAGKHNGVFAVAIRKGFRGLHLPGVHPFGQQKRPVRKLAL